MPDRISMTLHGTATLIRRLEGFENKVAARILGKATRAGTAPFVKAAKSNAPKVTGIFKRSLTSVQRSYRAGRVKVGIVGQQKGKKFESKKRGRGGISGRGDVVPIHFVEEDTRPHRIESDRPLAISANGNTVYRLSVDHPGTRGQHPIRKAAESSQATATIAFQAKLATEIDAEAARMEALAALK